MPKCFDAMLTFYFTRGEHFKGALPGPTLAMSLLNPSFVTPWRGFLTEEGSLGEESESLEFLLMLGAILCYL